MLSNITQGVLNCTPEISENSLEKKTCPGGKPLQDHCMLQLGNAVGTQHQ